MEVLADFILRKALKREINCYTTRVECAIKVCFQKIHMMINCGVVRVVNWLGCLSGQLCLSSRGVTTVSWTTGVPILASPKQAWTTSVSSSARLCHPSLRPLLLLLPPFLLLLPLILLLPLLLLQILPHGQDLIEHLD